MTKKQKKLTTIISISVVVLMYLITNFIRPKLMEIKFNKYNKEFMEIYSELINSIDIKNLDTALTEENFIKVDQLGELVPKMEDLQTEKTFFKFVSSRNFYLDIKNSLEKAKYWNTMTDTEKFEIQTILISNKSVVNLSSN
ncbi:hypothetical protein [Vallitalea sp.]|jgi:hypothetical protein|uniref:hypothetical protein n=1 Tax=Vallitalea sp. TaxID=1882829 RepID=UPI0025DD575D|nr:hypothetical protein [Vallitalea sp.]MCT4686784.1 hypothetical protein [Vallitalea sp.]